MEPEVDGQRMNLIFGHGRSGSSQLLRCLRDVGCIPENETIGEPFRPMKRKGVGFKRDITSITDVNDYVAFLLQDRRSYGKHLWTHLPFELNNALIQSPLVGRIVFLYRQSLFDCVMSLLVARRSKEWVEAKATEIGPIDASEVEHHVKELCDQQQFYRRLVQQSGTPYEIVDYESLYGSRGSDAQKSTLERILRFFSFPVEQKQLEHTISKWLSPDKKYKPRTYYSETVPNFSELSVKLSHYNHYYNNG